MDSFLLVNACSLALDFSSDRVFEDPCVQQRLANPEWMGEGQCYCPRNGGCYAGLLTVIGACKAEGMALEGMTRRAATVVVKSTYKPLGATATTLPEPQSLIYTVSLRVAAFQRYDRENELGFWL